MGSQEERLLKPFAEDVTLEKDSTIKLLTELCYRQRRIVKA
jgi:hypothetical protein